MMIACSSHTRSLQRWLFCVHLEKVDCDHSELLLHTQVGRLSWGKFLQRFRELYLGINILHAKHAEYNQLNDDQWLLDLAILSELTNLLNDLNIELQGKDKTIIDMISSVNSFKRKLHAPWLANFKNRKACYTEQIKNCLSESETLSRLCFTGASYYIHVLPFSGRCWGWLTRVKNLNTVLPELLWRFWHYRLTFNLRGHGKFWNLLTEEKYPNMRKCVTSLTASFSSTYLCDSAFSHMTIIKSKYRSTMMMLINCPDHASLAEPIQCKSSE